MRRFIIFVLALVVSFSSGCSALTAYAKQRIREEALATSDVLVDHVITRVGQKLDIEVSPEVEAEIRAAAKEAAREEIEARFSDKKLDEVAAEEPPDDGARAPE